jgi:hypothetical protein
MTRFQGKPSAANAWIVGGSAGNSDDMVTTVRSVRGAPKDVAAWRRHRMNRTVYGQEFGLRKAGKFWEER